MVASQAPLSSLQIRRLRIEIEKLQWLHQQELAEMKHNLGESPVGVSFWLLWSHLESGRAQSSGI